MIRCNKCCKSKPEDQFIKSNGLRALHCLDCREYLKKYSADRKRRIQLGEHVPRTREQMDQDPYVVGRYAAYGITIPQFELMLAEQDFACKICTTELRRDKATHIDHDHKTGRVRGLLCNKCNVGLGYFKDNPDLLDQAAQYLRTSLLGL